MKEYDEHSKIKVFITNEKRPNGTYVGIRVLATDLDDAEKKIKIHNKFSIYKTTLCGQLIKEIDC